MAEELIGGTPQKAHASDESATGAATGAASGEAPAPDGSVRVLIADDQDLVRSGFNALLSTYPGIEIVGLARNGDEAVGLSERLHPDVVLMDVRMPYKDGIQATREITSDPALAGTHVLVLTTFDIDQYVYDALAAGASGFLLKDADPDEIVHGIRVAAKGESLIQPSVMTRLVEHFVSARPRTAWAEGGPAAEAIASLTEREREILALCARGLSNDEIAAELVISPATVKTHLARIMAKTGAHDRAQLVVFAYETGFVSPSSRA